MAQPQLSFKKAEKKRAWIKVALTGPSGSGKTYSALRIATGMGGKVALIDTENGSASLYADQFDFDVIEIDPPFTVQKYIEAIKLAQDSKYSVLVIDSITHAWAGEGGLLQQKEDLDARGSSGDKGHKNKYANWSGISKQHENFKGSLLKADIHMIVTMRSKQDYVLQDNGNVKKVGMAPIQRDGMEYEFTSVLDIAHNHSALASKDRTKLFDSTIFTPTEETGGALMAWLNSGSGELIQRPSTPPVTLTPAQVAMNELRVTAEQLGYSDEELKKLAHSTFPGAKGLQLAQIGLLLAFVRTNPIKPQVTDGPVVGSIEDIAQAAAESGGLESEEDNKETAVA